MDMKERVREATRETLQRQLENAQKTKQNN